MALFYLTYLSLSPSLSLSLYLFETSKFCNVIFIFNFHRHTEVIYEICELTILASENLK